jgi:hypothetical protein
MAVEQSSRAERYGTSGIIVGGDVYNPDCVRSEVERWRCGGFGAGTRKVVGSSGKVG